MWYVILQARSVPLYIRLYTVRLPNGEERLVWHDPSEIGLTC